MAVSGSVEERAERVREILRAAAPVLIAYSGGVDSSVLLALAVRAGIEATAVIADSPSLPREALERALEQARGMGARVEILRTRELDDPRYAANPVNRCYFCKAELFERMEEEARRRGGVTLAYGENAEDVAGDRPGSRAAHEFSVLAPLREAGLGKADIRRLAREFGLSSAELPAMPCLSSRIPHGQVVTPEALLRVEKAEGVLRARGFLVIRVRHELSGKGAVARVLVGPDEVPRLFEEAADIEPLLRECGFAGIEMDARGYPGVVS